MSGLVAILFTITSALIVGGFLAGRKNNYLALGMLFGFLIGLAWSALSYQPGGVT